MIQISPNVLDELETIGWFKYCGQESQLSKEKYLRQVSTWIDADEVYDDTWESIKNRQQNAITLTLSAQHNDEFNQWNDLIKIAQKEVAQRVTPMLVKIIKDIGVNDFYTQAICRDIDLYVMEVTYAQAGCKIPIFFRNLFEIYKAGHFPCGWGGGDFPKGCLLYY